MLVTHKRLLEWNPSSDPDRHRRTDLAASCRTMWIAPVIATVTVIFLALSRPVALSVAGPILALWFASPTIAWWIRTSFRELELVEEREERGEAADTSWRKVITSRSSSQVNVIGMRVDEAIPVVEKAIDNALLNGFSELEIIHDIGTGRLRKAIREYLKEHPSVKEFKSGGSQKGGHGVTIVEIK